MRNKNFCKICGKKVHGRIDKIICSIACKKIAAQQYHKRISNCICKYCKKVFIGNKKLKYCSDFCRNVSQYYNDSLWNRNNYRNNKENLHLYQNQLNKKYRERNNLRLKQRRKDDINFRIITNLRVRFYQTLRENKKLDKTINLIGCSIIELKQHLEKQFQPNMTWNNYGHGSNKWTIDHIIPCNSFNMSNIEDQKKCFHYTNLQPLWLPDNCSKSDKILENNELVVKV